MPSKARNNRSSATSGAKTRAPASAQTGGNASRPSGASAGAATKTAEVRSERTANAGAAVPVVKRQPVARRDLRAVRRAEQRRRRNTAFTGIAAVLVVGAIVWALLTHLPSSAAKTNTPAASASCTPTASVIGPAAAQTPAPTPPPVSGKTITGDQGLQYIDVSAGCGTQTTQSGDTVTVIYTGWLQSSGKEFDSSLSHGGTFQIPSPLNSSQPQVIQGWNIGLTGMKVGATRRLIIPAALGYGSQGAPPAIPPNATLIFDVTIVSIDATGGS